MPVSVVIANYNQVSTLPIVLRSMANQTVTPLSVTVADDGSNDGSIEWIEAIPDGVYPFPLYYTTHRHSGYGLTIIENMAARNIKEGRILFTNSDVVHNPMSVECHSKIGGNQIAGGKIENIELPWSQAVSANDMNDFADFENRYRDFVGGLSNNEFVCRYPKENFYGIWGGNFSVAADKFWKVGGLNEEYHRLYGGEEADLIQRLMKTGVEPAWAYNSLAYHLGHNQRAYVSSAGNIKYNRDHL